MKMRPTERIEKWQEAYYRANNRPAPPMTFYRGWYRAGNMEGKRAKDVDGMIEMLDSKRGLTGA